MPARIRLQRHGKKGKPYFQIVVADSRARRDGRFIENLGNYNPNTNPATINLEFDKAVTWLQNGAQPSDTVRAILSYKGVMMKKHLLDGVRKGAFTEEVAEERFAAWVASKEGKIMDKAANVKNAKEEARLKQVADEQKRREEAAAALAAAEAQAAAEAAAAEAGEEATEEATEAVAEETTEAVAEEAAEGEETQNA
jgi:small subunit ribosomal protein S16